MVLGAALIALTPAVFMFLFSFQLMNRSIDRWFSPNTSELREDSTRVVLELAQYVTSNARGEAESIAATGAPDWRGVGAGKGSRFASRHAGGWFRLVYDQGRHVVSSFGAPPESSTVSLVPWLPEKAGDPRFQSVIPLHGPAFEQCSHLGSAQ